MRGPGTLTSLWRSRSLFDDKLIVRIGKTVPTYDFNNVTRPLTLEDESLFVPALSGLIYIPVFKNPTLIGAMPGYYNSAYGITLTYAPTKTFYVAYGVYDGNLARGEQTGLNVTPQFNEYTRERTAASRRLPSSPCGSRSCSETPQGSMDTSTTVDYAGALHDPVAATLFCAPQKARYTVINGRVVAEKGRVVTVDMAPVIQAHNRFARQFAEKA